MDAVQEPSFAQVSRSRAWYGATIACFVKSSSESVFSQLATANEFDLLATQRDAWFTQIDFLRKCLHDLDGSIYFEFNIPRMGRRIDTVLLIENVVFVVEFKVGEVSFDRAALDQVWDYALDLKNFHAASHRAPIVPILVATDAKGSSPFAFQADDDGVFRPISIHPAGFRGVIEEILKTVSGRGFNHDQWVRAPYLPTPTIVEAARALYANHSVEAILRHDAGSKNLRLTSQRVEELVDEARTNNRKSICFVTGVPGAGKTLVGLDVANRRRGMLQTTHAVFLSGNGPLVSVLREALTRDEVARQKAIGKRVRKGKVGESVKAFIQNVHHFRDDALSSSDPPAEHVVIFDEAQRAWNLRQTANFMRRKKGQPGFTHSEPEFLISFMDRHKDWAVIVCLVGGGQEINTGEAGINAWLDAINGKFPHWYTHISGKLSDSEYAAVDGIDKASERQNVYFDDSLHLAVSMRSFRAENVSGFVKYLLDCDKPQAQAELAKCSSRYPIVVTRDLDLAKEWIRSRARGSERYGLVASSKAQRLKPHAIDIRVAVNPVHWFLNDREDTRSSYYLEDAATEFQVQGLELDWACVTWDGDLRFTGDAWTYHDFWGDSWKNIRNLDNQNYLRNAYRVLLTRARQGMVVFIPPGDSADPTRSPHYYDRTFDYFREIGVPDLGMVSPIDSFNLQ